MRRSVSRRGIRLRVLGAVLAAATACSSPEQRFAEHVRRAQAYAAEGKRGLAVLEYTSALELREDAEAHERLGDLLRRQGAPEEAARHFQRAHELDPKRVSAIVSELYLSAYGNRARADELLAKAVAAEPESPLVYRARSELALIDGDSQTALQQARRAAELAPEDAENQVQLGRVYQGSIRRDQLQGRPPDDGLYGSALAAFERADQLTGGNVGARLERARLQAAWPGHDAEARASYGDAIQLAASQGETDLQIIALHALDDFARNRRDAATRVQALRQVVRLAPDKLPVWRDLAELLAGQEEELSGLFAELLKQRPEDPEAHRLYVDHLMAAGREQQAVDHVKASLAEHDLPALWDELVQLHLRRGQLPQARKAVEQLASDHPDDVSTHRARARLALAEGRSADAVEAASRVPLDDRSAEDFRLLALAEEQRGDLDSAQAAILQASQRTSGFAESIARAEARIRCARLDHAGCLALLRELTRRGLPLAPEEQLMSVRALAATGRGALADQLLDQLVSAPAPASLAVVEFAARRGAAEPRRSEELLRAADAREPGDPLVLRALVDLLRRSGRSTEALADLNRAIGTGPPNPATLLLRAELLSGMGELDRAEADALRAFEAAPGLTGAVDLLVDVYTRQQRLEQARKSFEEAESVGVLHPGGRLLLARLRSLAGDAAGARSLLEALLEDRPHMPAAMSELAQVLADLRVEPERAQRLAREAAQARRSSRSAAHAAGYVYLRTGLLEAALAELLRARDLPEPLGRNSEALLHYHLGLALAGLSHGDDARREFEQALALDPKFSGAEDAKQQLSRLGAARPS